jgi:NAD-dependent dihydropyrimidine dehydrogenase PreA subunit
MSDWALPEIDRKKCVLCGTCVEDCPQHVMDMQANALVIARPQDCNFCAVCEQICPEGAVTCHFEIGWA